MKGFDNAAEEYIIKAAKEEGLELNFSLFKKVINVAMAAEVEYLKSVGILKGDGTFSSIGDYDDDDAFDAMIDAITKAIPEKDPYSLSDLLEIYIDFHDQYLEDIGMLDWD